MERNDTMEVDIHLRSILKKSKTTNQNKGRRKVSFSNTARLFFSDKNVDKTSDIPQFKYVEINIVDKSSDKTVNSILFDDCKAEDFLVHKVVYDKDLIDDENDHDNNQYDVDHEEQSTNSKHIINDSVIQISSILDGSSENQVENENKRLVLTVEQVCQIEQNDNFLYEPLSLDTQNVVNETDFVVHEITEVEDEGLEFIVHKVVQNEVIDFEDSSILNEPNSNSNSDMIVSIQSSLPPDFVIDSEVKPISELSIENILEHDKIIAYNDQNNLSNSSIVDAVSNVLMLDKLIDFGRKEDILQQSSDIRKKIAENVVLSPPLQELSLEKIVRAHSDNILCELDISPLNSVQETDSESDISSEDTMIMMTSEECQKNEQHIRQSFLQYQSLKGNKPSDGSDLMIKISLTDNKLKNNEIKMDIKETKDEENIIKKILLKEETSSDKVNVEKSVVNNVRGHIEECPSIKINHSAVSIPQPIPGFRKSSLLDKILCPVDKYCESSETNSYKNSFRTCDNSSDYWDKTLSKVEIPKDVREWKIMPNSSNRSTDSCPSSDNKKKLNSSTPINNTYENETQFFLQTDDLPPISKPDELEHFVNESTERVERIRKRYHFSERSDLKFGNSEPSPSPLRGIRPRFGSTAEILQLMQKQNQSSFLHYDNTKSHMSWPFSDASSMSTMKDHEKINNSEHFYNSQRFSGEYLSPTSIENTYHNEMLHSNICDHYSILSCPSFICGEREAPEGASPPRSLIEHDSEEIHSEQNHSSDNVVYYSMKV